MRASQSCYSEPSAPQAPHSQEDQSGGRHSSQGGTNDGRSGALEGSAQAQQYTGSCAAPRLRRHLLPFKADQPIADRSVPPGGAPLRSASAMASAYGDLSVAGGVGVPVAGGSAMIAFGAHIPF